MIRSKNTRSIRSRCPKVLADRAPLVPSWPASQTLKSSMSSRRISVTDSMLVLARIQRASWRSAPLAASTLRGARNVAACAR
jgi:hypothetical protein